MERLGEERADDAARERGERALGKGDLAARVFYGNDDVKRARARSRRFFDFSKTEDDVVIVFARADNMIQIRKYKREEAMLKKRRCVETRACVMVSMRAMRSKSW